MLWHGLAKEFAKRGHEVTIFAKAYPGQPEHENTDGIRIVRWGGYRLTTSLAADLVKCLGYALGAVPRVPPGDVIVTNDFWTPALLPRLRPGAGRVFMNANRYPKHQFWMYGKVAGISAASGAVASEIGRQTPRLSRRVRVVPNAIDDCFLQDEDDRFRLRLRDGEEKRSQLTVLYVGRIHPEKGVDLLLEAWRRMGEMKIKGDVKLRIVGPYKKEQGGGGAEYYESLKRKAEGVEWGEPIFEPAKLAEEYRRADLFVYPSLAVTGEAMPLAPAEAMGCGAVPVVSDLEAFREYLVPGKNGWTFNHRESAAENLAAVLSSALSADLTKMREEARRTAGKFSPAKVADLHLKMFEDYR